LAPTAYLGCGVRRGVRCLGRGRRKRWVRGKDICRAREDIFICVFFMTTLALAPLVNMVCLRLSVHMVTWYLFAVVCDSARTLGAVQTAYSTVPEREGV
jgi:hypothetical protein